LATAVASLFERKLLDEAAKARRYAPRHRQATGTLSDAVVAAPDRSRIVELEALAELPQSRANKVSVAFGAS